MYLIRFFDTTFNFLKTIPFYILQVTLKAYCKQGEKWIESQNKVIQVLGE